MNKFYKTKFYSLSGARLLLLFSQAVEGNKIAQEERIEECVIYTCSAIIRSKNI